MNNNYFFIIYSQICNKLNEYNKFDKLYNRTKITPQKAALLLLKEQYLSRILNMYFFNSGIDMFLLNTIDQTVLDHININIDNFNSLLTSYKKILFISGDYPSYGGAATNCYNLQKYYKNRGVETYGFYFHYTQNKIKIKYDEKEYYIGNVIDITKITFKPDLIILKSPISFNLKKHFECDIFYLIGGIYKNELSNYYYNNTIGGINNKFINWDVLKQINNSTVSFANSIHTSDILQYHFNIKVHLFYSTFIPLINKEITHIPDNFDTRKYEYGFIISNFNRTIKNINNTIEFLKTKKNVILIGKESDKYKSYGFECIDLIENDKINDYLLEIKYILNDSFYESCSNIKFEALINGCTIIERPHVFNTENCIISRKQSFKNIKFYPNKNYNIKKGIFYIIGNITTIFTNINIKEFFKENTISCYLINNNTGVEPVFFVCLMKHTILSNEDLFEKSTINYKLIGTNTKYIYSEANLAYTYFYFGKYRFNKEKIGVLYFYDSYINDNNRNYNKQLFILIYSYKYGMENGNDIYTYISNLLKEKENKFHNEKALLFTKSLKGHGGVQKTSYQLIQLLDNFFNITVIFNDGKNNIETTNMLVNNISIPNIFCYGNQNKYMIEHFINSNNFKIIINNKLNDYFNLDIKQKCICICHNSMDSFNEILINNQKRISQILTINQFHKNLLIHKGVNCDVGIYHNYIDLQQNKTSKRNQFTFKIAFIGRISHEKNVQNLIDGVNMFNSARRTHPISLYIIGDNPDNKIKLVNISNNIIITGQISMDKIIEIYKSIDYVISASITEGKPFSIVEAMCYGIPCIHTNINGITELIKHDTNGFLFNLMQRREYEEYRYDLNFDKISFLKSTKIIPFIHSVLEKAYNISIEEWNRLSQNAYKYCNFKFKSEFCNNNNILSILKELKMRKTIPKTNKIFINFKPDNNTPYGGGNISTYYLQTFLSSDKTNFSITFDLESRIYIYLIIDPFKGQFKNYSLADTIHHKGNVNKKKIVLRVNDCDITREVNKNNSREKEILKHFNNIDAFIFNSVFIKNYYFKRFNEHKLKVTQPFACIINGCDQTLFKPIKTPQQLDKKIKIVTHHWSDNMNKGYDTYYKLWMESTNKTSNIEFVFIGKNVPKMFKNVPIIGPYNGSQLVSELQKCHIYITDSVNDSCPNHVLEAISCGLPILYSNKEGGARELCMMTPYKIGEPFNSHEELLSKIQLITNNYNFYRQNVLNSLTIFNKEPCAYKYTNFLNCINKKIENIFLPYDNNQIVINTINNDSYIELNERQFIKLVKGINIFTVNNTVYNNIKLYGFENTYTVSKWGTYKMNNSKINVLYCSDAKYYVGLFASLYSLIKSSSYTGHTHFNFFIPIEYNSYFSNLLYLFETKYGFELSKTVVYIDENILDPVLLSTKCYNGGGHLLNIANLSRLLIGEFFEYDKLIYLDCDSIIQLDILEKINFLSMKYGIYASLANIQNSSPKKTIIIKMENILDCNYDWNSLIGHKIDPNKFVLMGAPFVADCKKWGDIYKNILKIVNAHNKAKNGIYKLFTMSLQNLLFYNNFGDLSSILTTKPDLGSDRKKWDMVDLIECDILDWSGIYKPWYKNGLYRHLWQRYDILNLSKDFGEIKTNKHIIENSIKMIK